ncbi:restriction endonuclease subunit S [Streptococcus oralis]|uniref:restriction endonuclease subunit S n=1 Tax=Streptococcus oralis TaxID=1303 RepID=UPI0039C20C53
MIDCPHSTPKWQDRGIPVIRNYNLKDGKIDCTNLSFVSEEDYKERVKRAIPEESDIIISREAPMGVVGIVPKEFQCCLGQRLVLLKIDKSKCLPKYLLYTLMSEYVQVQIRRINQTGSIVSNLNISSLKELKIPLHNFEEQRKIANILSAIDDKIQINHQINQELEAMAKTLYDYWFVQFDFPDQNGKPYKSSGGKMVYNPELKREIPEGWEVEKLGELIQLERGVTYAKSDIVEKTTNDAIGVLRATNITRNVMDLNDLVYLTKDKINNKQIIKQNETLIVMSSGSKEHLGKNAINYYEEVIGFGAFCSKIVPQKYSAYINTFLQSSEFKCYLLKQSMGTNINNLTNSDILDCRIILPNEEILDKFENIVEKNIKLISNNYIQNQELTQLRDWLLPMLMNGQVKVENYTD